MERKTKHVWIDAIAVLFMMLSFIGYFFIIKYNIFILTGVIGLGIMIWNSIFNPYELNNNQERSYRK